MNTASSEAVQYVHRVTWRVVRELHGGYLTAWGLSGAFNDPALDRFRSPMQHRTPEAIALRAAVAAELRRERREYLGR